MYELPLFPLNTVLFPNTPIALHIFEPRYKLMLEQCIATSQPFGVVLIQQGQETLGPLPEPHSIGCTAHITQVERLADGRMNMVAVGVERFRIHHLLHDKPYLVGQVEPFELTSGDALRLAQAGAELRPWVERYLTVLSQAVQNADFDPARLPDDPLALGYLAAALVQIPSHQKQPLLAAAEATDLLADMRTIYRREVALLNAIIERDPVTDSDEYDHLFSLN